MPILLFFIYKMLFSILFFLPTDFFQVALLTDSEIREAYAGFVSLMGYVNYFIPFHMFASIMSTWLAFITTYFVIKFIFTTVRNVLIEHPDKLSKL